MNFNDLHFDSTAHAIRFEMRAQELADEMHANTCTPGCNLSTETGWLEMAREVLAGAYTQEEAESVLRGDDL